MVSRNDIEQVADGLHAAAIGEESWQAALTGLSRLVPCELATLEIMDAKSGAYTDFHASRALDINADYLAYYFQINPRLDGVLNRPDLVLMGDYDFLSETEMGRDEFYDDFLKPNGLRYCAGVRTVHTRALIGTTLPGHIRSDPSQSGAALRQRARQRRGLDQGPRAPGPASERLAGRGFWIIPCGIGGRVRARQRPDRTVDRGTARRQCRDGAQPNPVDPAEDPSAPPGRSHPASG